MLAISFGNAWVLLFLTAPAFLLVWIWTREARRLVLPPTAAGAGAQAALVGRVLKGLPLAPDEDLRLAGEALEMARSFSQLTSSRAKSASSRGDLPRGRVPLIGSLTISPLGATRKKRSGELLTIASSGSSR